MYFLTTSSFTCPTVSAKSPAAQKLSPKEIFPCPDVGGSKKGTDSGR